jgi:hypothetical protein
VRHRTARFSLVLGVLVSSVLAIAGSKTVKSSGNATLVDSGSFGIFQRGQRIATETFRVEQRPDYSTTTSDLKLTDGSVQSSELQLWSNGNLRKYVWRATAPEKAESVLEPGDQVLMQVIRMGSEKPHEIPYVLPASTIVLDDYFFVHRELLTWRYLASGCLPGEVKCRMPKAQLGIIVPRQHTPATVTMEYVGREQVTLRGTQQELNRFNLKSEDQNWQLWLDDHNKLVRIVIASENTEVVRD